MQKRAAVTTYIIIGIVILIIGILGLIFSSDIKRAFTESLNPEVKDLRLFVEECVKSTTEDVLRLAAIQGGYVEIPSRIEDNFAYLPPPPAAVKTPFWYFRGSSMIPKKELMEEQISFYVQDNIAECLAEAGETFMLHRPSDLSEHEATRTVRKFIICCAKIELWLLGYDVTLDGAA